MKCWLWIAVAIIMGTIRASAQSNDDPVLQVRPPAVRDGARVERRQAPFSWHCRDLAVTGDTAALLGDVCEFALSVESQLPDFICDQMTTRRDAFSTDTVQTEVTYRNGGEVYSRIKLNGKPAGTNPLDLPGMSSVGEFGTLIRNIFEPESATHFSFVKRVSLQSRSTVVYRFEISAQNSKWIVLAGGIGNYVAYHGVMWIDEKTSHVVRVEKEAEFTANFPFRELTVDLDYADTKIGARGPFLLPVRAKVIACQRGSNERCYRNTTTFSNYRKFTVDTHVLPLPVQKR